MLAVKKMPIIIYPKKQAKNLGWIVNDWHEQKGGIKKWVGLNQPQKK